MIKNLWVLVIIIIIITILNSSQKIYLKSKLEAQYYCVPTNRNEPKEQHPHPSEVEVVSVFELAGTYYGEAIGTEWI
jgi:hypothetical protein